MLPALSSWLGLRRFGFLFGFSAPSNGRGYRTDNIFQWVFRIFAKIYIWGRQDVIENFEPFSLALP